MLETVPERVFQENIAVALLNGYLDWHGNRWSDRNVAKHMVTPERTPLFLGPLECVAASQVAKIIADTLEQGQGFLLP